MDMPHLVNLLGVFPSFKVPLDLVGPRGLLSQSKNAFAASSLDFNRYRAFVWPMVRNLPVLANEQLDVDPNMARENLGTSSLTLLRNHKTPLLPQLHGS